MSSKGIDLGIDFGTTNCTIGRVRPDGNTFMGGPMPSVGAWSNGRVVFGDEGRDRLASDDESLYPIRDLKMLLARGTMRAGRQPLNPVELAAELLCQLKKRYFPHDEVRRAVIATPVRVPVQHRQAMREAATRAGIQEVRLVYEPTAALVGCWHGAHTGRDLALVIDWGGGTLDLALIRAEDGLYRELAVDGDINVLGGSRIDEELTRRVLDDHPEAREAVGGRDGDFDRFKQAVEGPKIRVLEGREGDQAEPLLVNCRWLRLEEDVYLKAGLVYDVVRQFARGADEHILTMLRQAQVRPDEVTHLLFAGGVCKCNAVRAEIRRGFPRAAVLQTDNPQMQTGLGCTRLTAVSFNLELAADFAARQCDDSLCILLPRGHRVALGTYREAEFVVTGVNDREAHFDLGVCHFDADRGALWAADASTFRSLTTRHVPLGAAELRGGERIPDHVKLYVGVDDNLTVAVFLESLRGRAQDQAFLSGVPLAIRIQGVTA